MWKVVFEIDGETGALNKCHCAKCRKVSGTGSNAVFWIEPENLRWVCGEGSVRSYEMTDGWQSVFCGVCGSPLPRLITGEEWIVPAGVLDEDVEVAVRAHIFVENKPAWEIIGDDAPQYQQGLLPKNGLLIERRSETRKMRGLNSPQPNGGR